MKQRILDKLRDRGGVTILMALFALLVASMVCIVILSASLTTVKQAKVDQSQEQNTLALQSAGELVLSEIKKTGSIVYKDEWDGTHVSSYTAVTRGDSSLSETLVNLVRQELNAGGTYSTSVDVKSEEAPNGAEQPYSQTVNVLFVLAQENQVGANSCKLTVTLSTKANDDYEQQYLYLKYSSCNISTVSDTFDIDENDPSKGQYSIRTTTFSWGTPRFYLAEDVSNNG